MHKDICVKQEFIKVIFEYFNTEVELIDFDKGRDSAFSINEWCDKKTNGKIYDLFEWTPKLDQKRLIIINVNYFKPQWLYQFDSNLTDETSFKLENGDEIPIEMMKITEEFKICEFVQELNASVCQLPFPSGKMFMTILLPHTDKIPLSDVGNKLNLGILKKMFDEECLKNVEFHLPKFSIDKSYEVNLFIMF